MKAFQDRWIELPIPKPKKDELLVKVHAFGLNRADLLQRAGKYPPPPETTPILGLEVAGEVVDSGERVMCLLSGGGYAEYVAVPKELVMPLPKNLSFAEGAAIPEAFLTAYQALFLIGELQPLQNVLIHAGGSGVGTAAIQLVNSFGATAIATTRSEEKREKCLELGAKSAFNFPFSLSVLNTTNQHGADLILDFIGQAYFEENFKALAQGGAIIYLATQSGATTPFDINRLMSKWATLSGTTLRSRPLDYRAHLIREFSAYALDRFKVDTLKPIIDRILPWSQIDKGQELLAQNEIFGKIVFQF